MPHRALLIGNWQYTPRDEGGFGPLNGPRNDLTLMKSALSHPDFGLFNEDEVELHTNQSWAEMRGRFFEFLSEARRDDSLLVYFTGHGDRLVDGRLALCGVDTKSKSLAATSFDTKELREWIEKLNRAPSTMVVLDCCYSGSWKGVVSDADISASLGSGTMVLSSGGNEPSWDGMSEDDASPFTAALAKILTDPEVDGDESGMLTVDEIYELLRKHDPPLQPPPKRNARITGTFALAKRARSAAPARRPLIAFSEPDVEPLELTFDGANVKARLESDDVDELELAAFADYRMAAVKRMSQLADAVIRAGEYDEDEWAQQAVRRAWNCVGVHLFETGLPSSVRERLRSYAEPAGAAHVLKLRLTFAKGDKARALESYPWEYLNRDADPEDERYGQEVRPLALSTGLLLERVVRAPCPRTLETELKGATSVGIVSSQPDAFGDAVKRIADGVGAIPDLNVVFDEHGPSARWGLFLDAIEQRPKLLVMSTPVRRGPQGLEIGFWPQDRKEADWHPAKDLISHFQKGFEFSAIVLVTFAGRPAQDAVRATSELASELAKAGIGPVVFVCHAPGYAKHVPELGEDTFPVLFLDVLGRGHRFDHAIYYAKNRVSVHGTIEARRTFGVPGYYVIEPDDDDHGEAKATSGVGASPGRPHPMAEPPRKEKPTG